MTFRYHTQWDIEELNIDNISGGLLQPTDIHKIKSDCCRWNNKQPCRTCYWWSQFGSIQIWFQWLTIRSGHTDFFQGLLNFVSQWHVYLYPLVLAMIFTKFLYYCSMAVHEEWPGHPTSLWTAYHSATLVLLLTTTSGYPPLIHWSARVRELYLTASKVENCWIMYEVKECWWNYTNHHK
jgi:hypothetical protein